ncbi:hypothetical protein ACQKJ1_21115 [Methylorubrum rhodesianum]|uniref:hypothetical protein n=1 Tax=Methylorubrum rhodesianum TaxID=29427 RepID=UPI003CFE260F
MSGGRRLMSLVLLVGLSAVGATEAFAHGPNHRPFPGHRPGHVGHSHWGHKHHHFSPWGYSNIYYGGHCHTRRWINDFGDVVVRRFCH